MKRLLQLKTALRVAISRLTQREQFVVVGGSLLVVALVFTVANVLLARAIEVQQRRVDASTSKLMELLTKRGEYRQRQEDHAKRIGLLASSHVRLVSLVEESARQAGIEIGQLRPEEGEPGSDGVYESRVDLRAAGLSVDRLQEFLNLLERGAGVVLVRHIKLSRPYKKDLAEVEMSVSAFKMKA